MKKIIGLLAMFLIAFSFSLAEDVAYTNRSFARLSYVIGNTYIQRAQDLGYEEGIVNMPITEGDRLSTTEGRAEIYIGNGSYVRLNHRTKLDFISLPRIDQEVTQIRLWAGSVYFSVRDTYEETPIEIHTPDISLYILESGIYRLDVHENAETEILVFQGMLEAAGESGSILIKEAQRISAVEGHFSSGPLRFMSISEDTFDRWNDYREVLIQKRLAGSYLPAELGDFEYELATYGEWVYVPPYGQVWVPGSLSPAWRPYHHGRWLWYPICGWTWLPYEPWGWVTCHYGRWHWRLGIGWYWIPTTHWGPGWVHWYATYDHWGWAPLSYYDRPGVIVNNIYYDRFSGSDYPHNSSALTMVTKNQLQTRDVSKVAVRKDSLKNERIQHVDRKPSGSAATTEIGISRLDNKKAPRTFTTSKSLGNLDKTEENESSTERKIRSSTKDKISIEKERSSKKKIESPAKKTDTRSGSKSDASETSKVSRSTSPSKVSKSSSKSSASKTIKSSSTPSRSESNSKSSSNSASKSASSNKVKSSKSRKKK